MLVQDVVGGGWRNKLAYMGLSDLQMPIIHTWNVSLNMWNYHTNYRCRPSFSLACHTALSCSTDLLMRLEILEQQTRASSIARPGLSGAFSAQAPETFYCLFAKVVLSSGNAMFCLDHSLGGTFHLCCATPPCTVLCSVLSLLQGRARGLHSHVPSISLPVLDLFSGRDPARVAPKCPGLCPEAPHAHHQASKRRPC